MEEVLIRGLGVYGLLLMILGGMLIYSSLYEKREMEEVLAIIFAVAFMLPLIIAVFIAFFVLAFF